MLMMFVSSHTTTDLVKNTVGRKKKAVANSLPQSLLKNKSAYFRACLSGAYKVSIQNEVVLDNVNLAMFELFVQ